MYWVVGRVFCFVSMVGVGKNAWRLNSLAQRIHYIYSLAWHARPLEGFSLAGALPRSQPHLLQIHYRFVVTIQWKVLSTLMGTRKVPQNVSYVIYELCDYGQVTAPFWASVSTPE